VADAVVCSTYAFWEVLCLVHGSQSVPENKLYYFYSCYSCYLKWLETEGRNIIMESADRSRYC